MGTEHVRILIADDHALFRDGLRRLVEGERDLHVVGEAGDADETIRLARQLQPDVLLLDLAMPGGGGIAALKGLHTAPAMSTRPIVLTGGSSRDAMIEALQFGARGIVLKESVAAVLFKSIRCVMRGEYWLVQTNIADLVQTLRQLTTKTGADHRKNRFGLTTREIEIVAQVTAGASNKDIAQLFSVREDTVKHHVSRTFDKLGVSSRVELAVFAIHHGLDELPGGNPA